MPGLYRVSGAAFGNTWRRDRAPRFLRGKLGAQISDCPIFTVPKTTLDVRNWSLPTQQIDFHVGIGLNENAPVYIFGIGYSFRLDGLLFAPTHASSVETVTERFAD